LSQRYNEILDLLKNGVDGCPPALEDPSTLNTGPPKNFIQSFQKHRRSFFKLQRDTRTCVDSCRAAIKALPPYKRSLERPLLASLNELEGLDDQAEKQLSHTSAQLDRLKKAQALAQCMAQSTTSIAETFGAIVRDLSPWGIPSAIVKIEPPFPSAPQLTPSTPPLASRELRDALDKLNASIDQRVTVPLQALLPELDPTLASHLSLLRTELDVRLQCLHVLYNIARAIDSQGEELHKIRKEASDISHRIDSLCHEYRQAIQQLLGGDIAPPITGDGPLQSEVEIFTSSARARVQGILGSMDGVQTCELAESEDKTVIKISNFQITLSFSLSLVDNNVHDAISTFTSQVRSKASEMKEEYGQITQTCELMQLVEELASATKALNTKLRSLQDIALSIPKQGGLIPEDAFSNWDLEFKSVEKNLQRIERFLSEIHHPHVLWQNFWEGQKKAAEEELVNFDRTLAFTAEAAAAQMLHNSQEASHNCVAANILSLHILLTRCLTLNLTVIRRWKWKRTWESKERLAKHHPESVTYLAWSLIPSPVNWLQPSQLQVGDLFLYVCTLVTFYNR
jgi:hypothetical protein